jgi:hypothetical protein
MALVYPQGTQVMAVPEFVPTRTSRMRTGMLLPFAALAFGLSCNSDGALGGGSGPPALLLVVAGQDQSALVGSELASPLRVKVVDDAGRPVRGQVVNFRVTSGGGSVFAGVAITSDSGTAVDRWTLGTTTSEPQRVEARAVDPNTGAAIVFGVFNATALPDVPASISRVHGDAQGAAAGTQLQDSLVVGVADRFGNPVSGVDVNWTVTAGGGSLSASLSQTNSIGRTYVDWILGTTAAESQQVVASVTSLAPAQFTATAGAGPATQLILQTAAVGAVVASAFTTQPVIRIADALGNTVTSAASISISVSGGGATVIGQAAVNATGGIATFTDAGLNGQIGTYSLVYSATLEGTARTTTQSINLVPGPAAKYVVTSSSSAPTVGTSVTITAQLTDANDAPVSDAGRVVTWSRAGANGSFANPTSATNASGIATITFTGDVVPGGVTITARDNAGLTGSIDITFMPGQPTQLVLITQPSNTGARATMRPTVRVAIHDQYSNVVTSSTSAVSLSLGANPGGAALSGGEAAAAVNGIATFANLLLDQPGTGYTLVAMSSGLPAATSSTFDVSAIATLGTVSPQRANGIALHGTSVYVTSGFSGGETGNLWRLPATGGTATRLDYNFTVRSNIAGRIINDGQYLDIVSTTGHTFLSGSIVRNTTIERVPLDGTAQTGVGLGISQASGGPDLAYDGTHFFLPYRTVSITTGQPYAGIRRIHAGTRASQTLVEATYAGEPQHFYVIMVHGGDLYFTNRVAGVVTIDKIPVDSGPTTTVVTGVGNVTADAWGKMIIVGSTIYWAESGAGGATDGSIRSAPITGGAATTRVSALTANVRSMVSDGTHLYVNDGGSIRRYRLSDFYVTTIVENDNVVDIAIDDWSVYWTTRGSSPDAVRKAPR